MWVDKPYCSQKIPRMFSLNRNNMKRNIDYAEVQHPMSKFGNLCLKFLLRHADIRRRNRAQNFILTTIKSFLIFGNTSANFQGRLVCSILCLAANCIGKVVGSNVCSRLRDPASWLPLAAGTSSRNLSHPVYRA